MYKSNENNLIVLYSLEEKDDFDKFSFFSPKMAIQIKIVLE